jgi:hypothetical protein
LSFKRKFSFAAFQNGNGHIPNNPLVATLFTALFKGGPNARKLLGGWFVNDEGHLEIRHIGRKGGHISVKLADSIAPSAECETLDAQWQFIERLSPLTADAAMAVLAELCHPGTGKRTKFPLMQPVPVTAEHVLRYKNFRRYGDERDAFRRRIEEEFRILQRLRIDIVKYPGWDIAKNCWNAHGVSVYGDKLFDLVEAELTEEKERPCNKVWLARLGGWARIWMNAQSKVWIVQVPQTVLQLDHRHSRGMNRLGKKIAMHELMLGATARARPVLIRRVDRLLEDLGELPDERYRTNHWVGRTRDRLEEALIGLVEQGVFAKIDWPEEFGPGAADRFKGWANSWLASKLHFTMTRL